jgi:hypothetical protein
VFLERGRPRTNRKFMTAFALLAAVVTGILRFSPSAAAEFRFPAYPPADPSKQDALTAGADSAARIEASEYPTRPGDVWRYRTQTTRPTAGAEPALESGLATIEILSRHRHGQLTVLAVSRLRGGQPAGEELTFLIWDGPHVYTIADPEKLRACLDGAQGVLDPGDAELDFPLASGKRWGRSAMLERNDGLYVYVVGEREKVDVPLGRFDAMPLEYRTLPDQMTTWTAAGVGMIRYEYLHHGSADRELWELLDYRHSPVDTAAIARNIDRALERLVGRGSFWSRRTALAADPTLRALLGPLDSGETVDLEDGVRRYYVRGDSMSLVLDQMPDGASQAYLLRWRDHSGLLRTFFKTPGLTEAGEPVEGGAVEDGGPGETRSPEVQENGPLTGLFTRTSGAFLEARSRALAGLDAEAGVLADAAAARLAEGLAALAAPRILNQSPEEMKVRLRGLIGDGFLTTRYGRRVRIEDGRFHVVLENTGGKVGVELSSNGDGGNPVGAAPRLLVTGPGGIEVCVLGTGSPAPVARRILSLDWAGESANAALVWSGSSPASPSRVELFEVDRSGAHQIWERLLPDGSARLVGPPARLELEYDEPDRNEPALRPRWRERWAPQEAGEAPVLLSRDMLNPWIRSAALLVRALRARDAEALHEFVRDRSLRNRLTVSWLARSTVAFRSAASQPAVLSALEPERSVSLTLTRGAVAAPEDPGPKAYVLEMTRAADGGWIVVDLTADTAGPWEP